jgi:phosphoglycerate dehydrogenase-like enzyme
LIALVPVRFASLFRAVPGVEVQSYASLTDLERWLHEAEILWADLWPLEEIKQIVTDGGRLRWLSTHAAGIDNLPHQYLRARGITVTNAAGLQAAAVAEFTVLLMLSAATGIRSLFHQVGEGAWPGPCPGRRELAGTAALVVGVGAIGSAVAARLRAFDVTVVGAGRRPGPDRLGADEWRPRLREFDWVILTAALTPATRHLIGASELAVMRGSAWLVNVSRGGLIDEAALIDALQTGEIGGACLDATDPEPPLQDSPLWKLPNVLLTPHVAGYSFAQDARAADLFSANLARFDAGQPLSNLVDLEAGY